MPYRTRNAVAIPILLVSFFALLTSGCANKDRIAVLKGESRTSISDTSKSDESFTSLKTTCILHYRHRDYSAFNSCFTKAQAAWNNNSKNSSMPLFVTDFSTGNGLYDTTTLDEYTFYDMHAMRAELLFDQQKYFEAMNASIESINDINGSIRVPKIVRTYLLFGRYDLPKPFLIGILSAIRLADVRRLTALKKAFEDMASTSLGGRVLPSLDGMRARIALEEGDLVTAKAIADHMDIDFPYTEFMGGFDEADIALIQINVFFVRGQVYEALGEDRNAVLAYQHAVDFPRAEAILGSDYPTLLTSLGRMHMHLSQNQFAKERLAKAIEVIERQRSTISGESGRIGYVGGKKGEAYELMVLALVDDKKYDEAFAYVERGKARALVDILASKQQFGRGTNTNTSEQNQLLAQLDTAEAKARVITSESEISKTRSVAIKSRTALTQQAPELSSLVSVEAPDVKEIQALLPAGETLIEYYGSGDNLFAFVVTADGIRGVKLNGKGLSEDVTAFREAILKPQGNLYQQSGNKLYERLIAPVASGISTQNLTIVAHGALHYLPFSALTSNEGFLIDQYNVRILPSASVMKFLKSNQNKAGSLLALGNPDLGDAKYDLPFAQQEAIKVSNGVVGSKLLVRADATETAVKTYGNSFRYLHFASHGTFDAEKPLNSGLLLAKDSQNDGMLTVGELYDLNLNADLVTLSACETALGKVANGDDVVGFTRGFLYAGASSIVSSLWQVDDAATSDLMTGFYKNLGTEDKRSALRDAQLATKEKYQHPYYWAAFQITGAVQ